MKFLALLVLVGTMLAFASVLPCGHDPSWLRDFRNETRENARDVQKEAARAHREALREARRLREEFDRERREAIREQTRARREIRDEVQRELHRQWLD